MKNILNTKQLKQVYNAHVESLLTYEISTSWDFITWDSTNTANTSVITNLHHLQGAKNNIIISNNNIIILNKNVLFHNDKLFFEFNVLIIKKLFFKNSYCFYNQKKFNLNLKINTRYKINNIIVLKTAI